MNLSLTVRKADQSEIYRDFARISEAHRGGIREGTLCSVTCCQQTAYLAVRGIGEKEEAIIKIDEVTRNKLGVEVGKSYTFEIEKLNFLSQLLVPWHASDPFNRQAMRLSIIGLFLGTIGFALGLISFFK